MGFSAEEDMVRVDFFKQSGKWYTTEAVKWTGDYWVDRPNGMSTKRGELIHKAFIHSLRDHFEDCPSRLAGMDAVCLNPYHEHSHPIMCKNGGWIEHKENK